MPIFICHASQDKFRIRPIVARLRERDFAIWFDEDSILPGESIPQATSVAIESSHVILVFLSHAAVNSRWVAEELGGALFRCITDASRHVVPVLLEECQLPPMLAHRKALDLASTGEEPSELITFLQSVEAPAKAPWIQIPGYHSFELVGEGGFGQVYKCVATNSNRIVAIKLALTRQAFGLPEQRPEFSLPDSPHVVPLLSTGTFQGRSYVVMPYVGHSLKWHIRHQKIKPEHLDSILQLADGILMGLGAAHGHGIVHCDIKPSNILIDDTGNPLICDFGLAQRVQDLQFRYSTVVRGTICYLSPEQQLGFQATAQSDIFSFGAVLYEMLTGAKPVGRFADASALNARVTRAVEEVLEKCLVVDVAKRYKSCKDVARDLRAARQNITLGKRLRATNERRQLMIKSEALTRTISEVTRLMDLEANFLITGPVGSGKTSLITWVHSRGPRRNSPLVVVNASAIPEALAVSEFFGYKKGAFTGATGDHIGHIERAHQGTLFLDEVADLPLQAQALLLRAMESGVVQRIGSQREVRVDVQWILASNRNLRELVAAEKFRADFLDRISFAVSVPPIWERQSDIAPLLFEFVSELGLELVLEDSARATLASYSWPGNVREIRAFASHLAVHEGSGARQVICSEAAFERFRNSWQRHLGGEQAAQQRDELVYRTPLAAPLAHQVERFRQFVVDEAVTRVGIRAAAELLDVSSAVLQRYAARRDNVSSLAPNGASRVGTLDVNEVEHALRQTKGNVTASALLLNVPPRQIYRLLKRHRIDVNGFRRDSG